MAKCEQCGNDYDKSFEVRMGGRTMIFRQFRMRDPYAGAANGSIFCCVHCARREGVTGLRDRD
jgi:hypothetical protein